MVENKGGGGHLLKGGSFTPNSADSWGGVISWPQMFVDSPKKMLQNDDNFKCMSLAGFHFLRILKTLWSTVD